MLIRLLFLFIATPLVEIWLLMLVSARLGPTPTIGLVLITGCVGATLSKRQGLQAWQSIQRQTQQGQVPAAALVDALMIFVAGLLLITPGILTDFVGFSLLVPVFRAGIRRRLQDSFKAQASVQIQGFGSQMPGPGAQPQPGGDDVIDVEYEKHSSE